MQRGARFFEKTKKNVPMQRGAQSARRHFGGVVLPTYVFQYIFKKSRSHAAWGGGAS